ncbi:MAG: endonuclease III [Bacteroidales bacterium]|nr:endonuclease III [Bacteroidales bacterium]
MEIDWNQSIEPLLKQYKGRQHPLDYKNRYQLVVMVILSAQDSDRHINEVAKQFFEEFPTMEHLAVASVVEIQRLVSSVRNFENKSAWLSALAKAVGADSKIPHTLDELIKLPGVGRKSANVIIRESGDNAEGVIVDLHVVRVAPRLGLAEGAKPEKIEKQLMAAFPQDKWNKVGMAISFLGREVCRPTNPKCTTCVMSTVCEDYKGRKNQ